MKKKTEEGQNHGLQNRDFILDDSVQDLLPEYGAASGGKGLCKMKPGKVAASRSDAATEKNEPK